MNLAAYLRSDRAGIQSLMPGTIPRLLLLTHPDGSQQVADVIEWLCANRRMGLRTWQAIKVDALMHFKYPKSEPAPYFRDSRIQLCTTRHFCGAILSMAAPALTTAGLSPPANSLASGAASIHKDRAA